MKTPKSRTTRSPVSSTTSPLSREELARRLKVLVVAAACVLGAGLGIGSAAMSQVIFASGGPEAGRRVTVDEFQGLLGVQAEAAMRASHQEAPGAAR